MITKHMRFTQQAQAEPRLRFTALMGLLSDREELRASFHRQTGKKAQGVDGIGKQDYAKGLEETLRLSSPTGSASLYPERQWEGATLGYPRL